MARGHVRQRGKGWVAVVELPRDPITHKRKQRWLTARTKREAQAKLTAALAELDRGSYIQAGRLTVSQFLDRWLQDYAEPRLRPTSVETYRTLLGTHVRPALGALRLDALTPTHLQGLYRRIQAPGYRNGPGLSATSALLVHSILHRSLFHAVRWQLLRHNPADHLEPPRADTEERAPLDLEQMAALLHAVQGTWLYLPVLIALTTGLGRGEVLGLRWSDLQAKGGMLQVRQQVVRVGGKATFGPLKRPGRRRAASMPELLLVALEQERAAQARLARDLGGAYHDHGLVVCRPDGEPYHPSSLTKAFCRLAHRLGLSVTFHDLRHSHTTLLFLLGVHPKVVSERLGHSSLSTTMDTYSHILPPMQAGTAELVDGAFREALRLQSACTDPLNEPDPGTDSVSAA